MTSSAFKAFDIISNSTEYRDKLEENTQYFRNRMKEALFDIPE